MVRPAWPLDIIQRVSKVVRSAGVFVAGVLNTEDFERPETKYAKVLRDDRQRGRAHWQQVHEVTDAYSFTGIGCGAFGLVGGNPATGKKPVPAFVLGGQRVDPWGDLSRTDLALQLIITSSDGNAWSKTRTSPSGDVYIMGFNRNEGRFYAQAANQDTATIDVLSSSDGRAWAETGGSMSIHTEIPAAPQLTATGTSLIRDTDDMIVPNGGFYGWNGSNIWIKPKLLVQIYRRGFPLFGPGQVEIIRRKVDPESGAVSITRTTKTVPMEHCARVAFGGGVWQAAGFNGGTADDDNPLWFTRDRDDAPIIAQSTNNGDTWDVVYTKPREAITCLLAGEPTPNA